MFRSPVSDEYIAFAYYSDMYVEHAFTYSNTLGWREITAKIVSSQIFRGTCRLGPYEPDQINIGRYQAVCSGLQKDIDQDTRAKDLWYDLSLRPLNDDVQKINSSDR